MSFRHWIYSPRARRGLAASIIVLSLGGLVLASSEGSSRIVEPFVETLISPAAGPGSVTFTGPGAHGVLSFSHTKVLADSGEQRLFAELRLIADDAAAVERAPLSLVVVMDTSGSMQGDKIAEAKRSIIQLIRQMADDDEIAVVRYASDSERIQPLARVGTVRSSLIAKLESIRAEGGTDIPPALADGLDELSLASKERVKRVVLVSDGLDASRQRAEQIAQNGSSDHEITVSSLGIGLDFDESYLSAVASAGRGNFGFVKDPQALASFLRKELQESAQTTLEAATARLVLPPDLRFVRAIGAPATGSSDGAVDLRLGSLYAGDERRVVIELSADLAAAQSAAVEAQVAWRRVGGERASIRLSKLRITGVETSDEVRAGRDGAVYASCLSALASLRQLEAAQAYQQGDTGRAVALIDKNLAELEEAKKDAPQGVARSMSAQSESYRKTKGLFGSAAPESAAGKAAAKQSAADDSANLGRASY